MTRSRPWPSPAEAVRLGVELIAGSSGRPSLTARGPLLGTSSANDDPAISHVARLRSARVDRLGAMANGWSSSPVHRLPALRCASRAPRSAPAPGDWLTRTGQVVGIREAFERLTSRQWPAQVPKLRLDWSEAVALTAANGGRGALAHPPYDLREST